MNILIATDSHKDFASSLKVGRWIERGLKQASSDFNIEVVPIGDGGEGTIDALVFAKGGTIKKIEVHDPLFRKRKAKIGILDEESAVVEIAEASGSAILEPNERNTMIATSYGTGELILHALDMGCKKIIIGLGGSIVSDGGMGMAQALGARFYERNKKGLKPIQNGGFNALSLPKIEDIDVTDIDKRIQHTEFLIAADVNIPLLGPQGQARTFGPQKKAKAEEIEFIEYGLTNWARVLYKAFNKNFNIHLAGAAGGLGSGLSAFLKGRLELGIETVLREINFTEKLDRADLIITGEGQLDRTSLHGKASIYIADEARKKGKKVIGLFGTVLGDPDCYAEFFDKIITAFQLGTNSLGVFPEECERAMIEAGKHAGEWVMNRWIHSVGRSQLSTTI